MTTRTFCCWNTTGLHEGPCATSLFYICEAILWVVIMGAGVRKRVDKKKKRFLTRPLIKHSRMPPGRLKASKTLEMCIYRVTKIDISCLYVSKMVAKMS